MQQHFILSNIAKATYENAKEAKVDTWDHDFVEDAHQMALKAESTFHAVQSRNMQVAWAYVAANQLARCCFGVDLTSFEDVRTSDTDSEGAVSLLRAMSKLVTIIRETRETSTGTADSSSN